MGVAIVDGAPLIGAAGNGLDVYPVDGSGVNATASGGLPEGGRGVTLDGETGYLRSQATNLLSGVYPDWALEVVVTINALPGVGQEPAIAGKTDGSFGLTLTSGGIIRAYHNGTLRISSSAISVGQVLHIVYTYAAGAPNDTIALYVNGVSQGSATPATFSPSGAYIIAGKHWTNAHYLSATYGALVAWTVPVGSASIAARAAATAWTDVTADTRGAIPLIIERGIRSDSPAQRVASTGTLSFALNNLASNSGGVTGYYSPGHASCRAGFAKGIPVRVLDASNNALFVGRVRSIAPTPGKLSGVYTAVTATDYLDRTARYLMDTPPVLEDVRADQVFHAITGLVPVQPHGITAHQGNERYTLTLDNTRDESVSVLQEFTRIANSELGYIYVTREGALVHEARTTRQANQGEAQVTLSDTMHGLDVAEVSDTSLNRVQLTVHPRVIDSAATTVLWALVNPLQIEAGETKTLIGPYRTADAPGITTRVGGLDMVTPVSTTDYTMNDASDGSGTDRTASLSVTANYGPNGVQWTLVNTHTGRAYITKLQCRGKGVYDFRTVVLRAQNDAAIASDGVSALNIDMPYQEDPNVAQALANDLLAAYGDLSGTRAKSVAMILGANGLPADLHLYDISDRVAVSETITGATGDYYINGVRLECQSGRLPTLKWWLTPAGFPMAWTAVSYAAGNFTASAGSWTVDSGDVGVNRYTVVGKTLYWSLRLDGTDVSTTPTYLRVAIPGGYLGAANQTAPASYAIDAGTVVDAVVTSAAAATYVQIWKTNGANWTATSSDNTTIHFNIVIEVQ